jgi:hypothetical protein
MRFDLIGGRLSNRAGDAASGQDGEREGDMTFHRKLPIPMPSGK